MLHPTHKMIAATIAMINRVNPIANPIIIPAIWPEVREGTGKTVGGSMRSSALTAEKPASE